MLDQIDWRIYQRQFISRDGRVIDTGRDRISHSEGQGFGLLFAVAFEDRVLFDRIWSWTRDHLQVRDDHLFAWKWIAPAGGKSAGNRSREENGSARIADMNNATDGDILIAWALYRGGRRWGDPTLVDAARAIVADLRKKVIRRTVYGPVLLPGEYGFDADSGGDGSGAAMTVNLSYWVFPALDDFNRLDPDPIWNEVIESGEKLITIARFGRWAMPPDWLDLSVPLSISRRFPARSGYDAIRIPLYLSWSGRSNAQIISGHLAYFDHFDGASFLSAWTDLNDDTIDSRDAGQGFHAIARLSREALSEDSALENSAETWKRLDPQESYYSSSLFLLSKLAASESLR